METLVPPTTALFWVDEEKNSRIVSSTIQNGVITLKVKSEGDYNWSLIITTNQGATYLTLKSNSLEEAKIKALKKLKEIIDETIIDASAIILS